MSANREGESLPDQDLQTPAGLQRVNQELLLAGLRMQELADAAALHAAQLAALLEGLGEGVIVVEAGGRIMLKSETAHGLDFLDEHEVATPADLLRHDVRGMDGAPLPPDHWPARRALRGESFTDVEVALVRPDGANSRLLFSGNALRGPQGDVAMAIVVCRDVTGLRQLEQMREEYVSLITHDLRTPLTAIIGRASLMLRALGGVETEGQPPHLTNILENARRMDRMLRDMTESARLEAGPLALHPVPSDLPALLAGLVRRLTPPDAPQRLQLAAAAEMPLVLCDPEHIERVFANLISNALKFSPAETPVTLRVAHEQSQVSVTIQDHGDGIAADELPHLFTRYFRARTGNTAEGTGLGLYITKRIIEAHGGSIRVESESGEGCTFYVTLPLGDGG